MNYSNHPATKEFRQKLRRDATPCERILWRHLKGRQIEGCKFRQQHGYGPFVLDFYCPSIRLCIEVDGEVHDLDEVKRKDEERTLFLYENRISIIRFKNKEIENEIDSVINRIKECVRQLKAKVAVQTPNPLT